MSGETQWILVNKFPMHKWRINLNFSVSALTFGFKTKNFGNLRHLYRAVLAGTVHARRICPLCGQAPTLAHTEARASVEIYNKYKSWVRDPAIRWERNAEMLCYKANNAAHLKNTKEYCWPGICPHAQTTKERMH